MKEISKILILLFFISQISNFPIDNGRYNISSVKNRVSCFHHNSTSNSHLTDRFDDDMDDFRLDLSSLYNDSNVMKSENDIDGFQLEDRTETKLKYGKLYQGDINLTESQKVFLQFK